jgi:hypothetical protein
MVLLYVLAVPLIVNAYRFDNAYTEVWYCLAATELNAGGRADGAGFERYSFLLQIYNQETDDSARVTGEKRVGAATSSSNDNVIDCIPLRLYEGVFEYTFSVGLGLDTSSVAGTIVIPADTFLFSCSDLVLGKQNREADFRFHEYAFIPAVGQQFSRRDTLVSYVEIYGLIPDSLSYITNYRITDSTEYIMFDKHRAQLKHTYTQVDTCTMPLYGFTDGTYLLSVEIDDPAQATRLWCTRSLFIVTGQDTISFAQSMSGIDDEQQRRLREADQSFSTGTVHGRTSGRGVYYVEHGKPDYVERFPMIEWARPLELWHYFSANEEVLFCDTKEDGNYQLIATLREGEFSYVLEFGLRDPEMDTRWPWLFKIAPGTFWGQKTMDEQIEDIRMREEGIEDE